jgi:predicted nucleic-acid-binding protein
MSKKSTKKAKETKKFYIDTNVFLRLFLEDNSKQLKLAQEILEEARAGKVSLKVVPQVLFEVSYVLSSVYKYSREETSYILSAIVKTDYLDIERRDVFLVALDVYEFEDVDLVDAYLFFISILDGATVFSFGKDFKKIDKYYYE